MKTRLLLVLTLLLVSAAVGLGVRQTRASERPLSQVAVAFKTQLTTFTTMRLFLYNVYAASNSSGRRVAGVVPPPFHEDFSVGLHSSRKVVIDADLSRYLWAGGVLTRHQIMDVTPMEPTPTNPTWVPFIGPLFDALRSPATVWLAEAPPDASEGFAGGDYAHPILPLAAGWDIYIEFGPANGVERATGFSIYRDGVVQGYLQIVRLVVNPTLPPLAWSPYAPAQKVPFPKICSYGFECPSAQ